VSTILDTVGRRDREAPSDPYPGRRKTSLRCWMPSTDRQIRVDWKYIATQPGGRGSLTQGYGGLQDRYGNVMVPDPARLQRRRRHRRRSPTSRPDVLDKIIHASRCSPMGPPPDPSRAERIPTRAQSCDLNGNAAQGISGQGGSAPGTLTQPGTADLLQILLKEISENRRAHQGPSSKARSPICTRPW